MKKGREAALTILTEKDLQIYLWVFHRFVDKFGQISEKGKGLRRELSRINMHNLTRKILKVKNKKMQTCRQLKENMLLVNHFWLK